MKKGNQKVHDVKPRKKLSTSRCTSFQSLISYHYYLLSQLVNHLKNGASIHLRNGASTVCPRSQRYCYEENGQLFTTAMVRRQQVIERLQTSVIGATIGGFYAVMGAPGVCIYSDSECSGKLSGRTNFSIECGNGQK